MPISILDDFGLDPELREEVKEKFISSIDALIKKNKKTADALIEFKKTMLMMEEVNLAIDAQISKEALLMAMIAMSPGAEKRAAYREFDYQRLVAEYELRKKELEDNRWHLYLQAMQLYFNLIHDSASSKADIESELTLLTKSLKLAQKVITDNNHDEAKYAAEVSAIQSDINKRTGELLQEQARKRKRAKIWLGILGTIGVILMVAGVASGIGVWLFVPGTLAVFSVVGLMGGLVAGAGVFGLIPFTRIPLDKAGVKLNTHNAVSTFHQNLFKKKVNLFRKPNSKKDVSISSALNEFKKKDKDCERLATEFEQALLNLDPKRRNLKTEFMGQEQLRDNISLVHDDFAKLNQAKEIHDKAASIFYQLCNGSYVNENTKNEIALLTRSINFASAAIYNPQTLLTDKNTNEARLISEEIDICTKALSKEKSDNNRKRAWTYFKNALIATVCVVAAVAVVAGVVAGIAALCMAIGPVGLALIIPVGVIVAAIGSHLKELPEYESETSRMDKQHKVRRAAHRDVAGLFNKAKDLTPTEATRQKTESPYVSTHHRSKNSKKGSSDDVGQFARYHPLPKVK